MFNKKSLLALAVCVGIVTANTCGGNCPSGNCASCKCGTSRDVVDIGTWCAKYSGWNQACCKCVVSHESGGNAHAQLDNHGGLIDVGLWQIDSINWKSCNGGNPPCDVN
jgi:hypothetical protein